MLIVFRELVKAINAKIHLPHSLLLESFEKQKRISNRKEIATL